MAGMLIFAFSIALAAAETPKIVRRCYRPGDHFITTEWACASAGATDEGAYGCLAYSQEANTEPLYRCLTSGGQHFATKDGGCEGAGGNEGVMGYIYNSPTQGSSHYYNRQLRRCQNGKDIFESKDSGCEGFNYIGDLGYMADCGYFANATQMHV